MTEREDRPALPPTLSMRDGEIVESAPQLYGLEVKRGPRTGTMLPPLDELPEVRD